MFLTRGDFRDQESAPGSHADNASNLASARFYPSVPARVMTDPFLYFILPVPASTFLAAISCARRVRSRGLGSCGGLGLTRGLRFPDFAEFAALLQHEGLGFVEIRINARALDGVARRAARHQIIRIFLAFLGPWLDEVHAHDQGVLKAGASVQPAVTADEIVALQDLFSFFTSYRRIHEGQGSNAKRHGNLQVGNR